MQPTSNFLVDINGATPGIGYDQVTITGAGGARIALNNSNLVITVGTTLTYGQTFDILNIANTGAFNTGEFAQGDTVTSGRYTFSISYPDYHTPDKSVTLTVVPEPSTWIGGALAVAALAYTQRRRLRKLLVSG
jgi:hypothetical protein